MPEQVTQPAAAQEDSVVNNAVDEAADEEGTNLNDPVNNSSSNDPVSNTSNDPVDFTPVYIDDKRFFEGLQDDGKQLTLEEINTGAKRRGCIMHGQSYYKQMYDFSKELYNHYKTQETILPKLRKNDSKATHMIGQKLIEMRQTTTRADIHKVVTDGTQLEFSKSNEYASKSSLSFLSQKTWVEWVISKWATTASDEKKTTPDDMVRAVGIMFMEDMREYIPYLLTVNDPCSNSNNGRGRRQSLDGWTSKRNLAIRNLHTRFIDLDCVVVLNDAWNSDEARKRIDERLGNGAYDNLNINPNNPQRIKVAFTDKEVLHHFSLAILAYNNMMKSYKMETGGGSGDPLLVVAWQEREPLDVVGYTTNKEADEVYLTPIHLWDKAYDFPLTVVKESGVSDGMGIDDDDIDYGNHQGEEDWDVSTVATGATNLATPGTTKTKRKDTLQLQSILRQQSKIQKAEREDFVSKMVAAIKDGLKDGEGEEDSKVDKQAKLQEAIAMSKDQLEKSKADLRILKRKRMKEKELSCDSPSNERLKKRFLKADGEAKLAAKEVKTFQLTLESQVEQLRKLSSKGNGDDKDDDIDLSDVSDEGDNSDDE